MKRFSSIILCLVFVCCMAAGCGNNKASDSAAEQVSLAPLTEVHLQDAKEVAAPSAQNSVGLMAFYPNDNENMYALAGTNTLTVYFENKRVKVGAGRIGIYEKASNAIYASRDAADTSAFEIGTMDEIGTALTGWTEGTKIDIYFDKVFIPGAEYYVLIDEGFFTLGTITSGAVTNASLINFKVKQYGIDVSGLDLNKTYNVGDTIALNILCDGTDATMFAFKEYDQQFIETAPLNGTADTTASIKFLKSGTPSITVAFYKQGHEVDSISFIFNVAGDEVPAEGSSSETSSN